MSLPKIHISDSILVKSIDGSANANANGGDGGNGIFKGDVNYSPTFSFDPTNTANGATVTNTTGDSVHQKASWDADASHKAHASSNGDQSSTSGNDTSTVHANTTATQDITFSLDQSLHVMGGIGGDGGAGGMALGGSVDIQPEFST